MYERLDAYQLRELEPSICQQLDVVGMQPHSREYLEYNMNCARSYEQFEDMGQYIDYPEGIHFGDTP